jgi:hypothetical protein
MYPLVRLAGVKVACYTHYPTISTNMLLRVMGQRSMYNNTGYASKSVFGALAKLVYYYIFACFYGMAGGCANVRIQSNRTHLAAKIGLISVVSKSPWLPQHIICLKTTIICEAIICEANPKPWPLTKSL